jgi:hypothetical protein
MNTYIDNVNYFRLVLLRHHSGSATTNVRHTVTELAAILDKMVPRHHGLVADVLPSGGNVTSSLAVVSLFVSASHFDVFGTLLPASISGLGAAIQFMFDVYNQRNLTLLFASGSEGNDVITGRLEQNIGGKYQNKIKELFDENCKTLERYISAIMSTSCWRCSNFSKVAAGDTKVIAMSLYGSDRRYTIGAIRNAQLLPVIYPAGDWRLWFYVETVDSPGQARYELVPAKILQKLVRLGAELRPVVGADRIAPMLWRFKVAVDPQVGVFVVRDADSRLTSRDAAVVADWLQHPNAAFHCVRDHPSHSAYAVSGGLWGGRTTQLAAIFNNGGLDRGGSRNLFVTRMQRYTANYIEDMNFLCRDIWPIVKNVAYCHDSFSCDRYPASHPFPVQRVGSEHLGQVYDEYSIGRQGDINILMSAQANMACVPT